MLDYHYVQFLFNSFKSNLMFSILIVYKSNWNLAIDITTFNLPLKSHFKKKLDRVCIRTYLSKCPYVYVE